MLRLFVIKRIAAVVLLSTFFMPLSQCTHPSLPFDEDQTAVVSVHYAYTLNPALSWETILTAAGFLFPLLLTIVVYFRQTINKALCFKLFEITGCLGSAYIVFVISFFGEILYGGIIALSAISIYILFTLYELILIIKTKEFYTTLKKRLFN